MRVNNKFHTVLGVALIVMAALVVFAAVSDAQSVPGQWDLYNGNTNTMDKMVFNPIPAGHTQGTWVRYDMFGYAVDSGYWSKSYFLTVRFLDKNGVEGQVQFSPVAGIAWHQALAGQIGTPPWEDDHGDGLYQLRNQT